CLQGPIGSDTGCFGPNNVVVVTFKNAINDLTRGPGENNTVVVAYHAAEKIISDTGGQLGKGAESVCNGIAHTLFGGDKSC
ncbi:hypothetical protein, partial [Klebsiella pneumoniae]|uniref:hypothetical protein n=1 Tax=Klebsiella pneumoniae TaxID=573 RepID=UPI003D002CC9